MHCCVCVRVCVRVCVCVHEPRVSTNGWQGVTLCSIEEAQARVATPDLLSLHAVER